MFHSVELRAYVHATEEEGRVERAVRTVWPGAVVATERFEGHHGNPLLMMTCRIEGREDIETFWRHLKDAGAVPAILEGIEERVDEDAVLHFRVDKQRAFEGAVELTRHDDVIAVRAKVVAHPAKRSAAIRAAREYLSR